MAGCSEWGGECALAGHGCTLFPWIGADIGENGRPRAGPVVKGPQQGGAMAAEHAALRRALAALQGLGVVPLAATPSPTEIEAIRQALHATIRDEVTAH